MVDKTKAINYLENAKDHDDKSMHKMHYHQLHHNINPKHINIGGTKLIMERLRGLVREKLKGMTVNNRQPLQWQASRLKLSFAGGAIAALLLCACLLQLSTLGDLTTLPAFIFRPSRQQIAPPPPRIYKSNGYLMVSSNGGLNQMRAGICDMVAIARYLNATLIVPELDKTSFWNDHSKFGDIFDMDHFIASLRDQVRILKELPKQHARPFSMPPVSWSNLTFYDNVVLPRLQTYGVLHFTKTDSRLANNGIPLETQQLRCRANYQALKFTPQIEETGKKIVKLLRKNGPFIVLHLRYEMDMLAFSGCTEGCNDQEIEELTKLRYAYPWWKEKEIDSVAKRKAGRCPLTPEETALALRALDVNPGTTQIYIAAGDNYGGEKRLALLRLAFPRLVKKETLLTASELEPFRNHSNQMAALDYIVALESDVFVPTHKGNMALVVEGHRRYLGFKTTIVLNKRLVVYLVDRYRNGTLSWNEFAEAVKTGHAGQFGTPAPRLEIRGKPKEEQYFYSNPYECLPPFTHNRS